MAKKQKICLVTGAAGFIGSHLCEKLTQLNFSVRGIDCFLDNYPAKIKKQNIQNLLRNENFQFIEGNLLELDLLKLIGDADFVFHEAAQPGVRQSWGDNFKVYVDNNILATQLLLEAVKGVGLKKFLYASSSSVYGDAETFPTSEIVTPRPVSPYGTTKLAAEHLSYLYFRNFGIPVIALRYFTVYGPRQRPDMAFHKFLKAALLGEEIEVYGDGKQTRDFTFIDDAISANILAMDSDIVGEVFNIGGGSGIILNEAIRLIKEITGKKVSVIHTKAKRGDVRHTSADISKAQKILKYKPQVNIHEGLRRQFDWLKERMGG